MATKTRGKNTKVVKVKYPDYKEMSLVRDEMTNKLQSLAAGANGLDVLAKEYRGRRQARKFERELVKVFMASPEAVATVKVEGLGTYTAIISDIKVALDKDKEPTPMFEIFVYRGEGEDSQYKNPEVYYDNSWSWNLMDGIHAGVEKMYNAIMCFLDKDFKALPEDQKEY